MLKGANKVPKLTACILPSPSSSLKKNPESFSLFVLSMLDDINKELSVHVYIGYLKHQIHSSMNRAQHFIWPRAPVHFNLGLPLMMSSL
jgi:hypothetical protein